jgi:hypothetical protein
LLRWLPVASYVLFQASQGVAVSVALPAQLLFLSPSKKLTMQGVGVLLYSFATVVGIGVTTLLQSNGFGDASETARLAAECGAAAAAAAAAANDSRPFDSWECSTDRVRS